MFRPVSAYAMFFRDTQAQIKNQNPAATFGEVSKIVAAMWDGLNDDVKQVRVVVKIFMCKITWFCTCCMYNVGLQAKNGAGKEGISSEVGGIPSKPGVDGECHTEAPASAVSVHVHDVTQTNRVDWTRRNLSALPEAAPTLPRASRPNA